MIRMWSSGGVVAHVKLRIFSNAGLSTPGVPKLGDAAPLWSCEDQGLGWGGKEQGLIGGIITQS